MMSNKRVGPYGFSSSKLPHQFSFLRTEVLSERYHILYLKKGHFLHDYTSVKFTIRQK